MAAHASSDGAVRIEVMRTSGACAGIFGPGSRAAGILSVHPHAINLLVEGSIFTLSDGTPGALPNGMQIRGFKGVRDSLRAGTKRRIVADFADASVWSPRLPCLGIPSDMAARRRALERAMRTLPAGGLLPLVAVPLPDASAGNALVNATLEAARAPFARIRDALVRGDAAAAAEAGGMLVGLGPGLTPSGDDLLVGLTGMLTAAGHPLARKLAVEWAFDAERGTGLVARAFHRHAAAGEYSERIHRLMAAILVEPIDGIDAAVRRAADWGATSGGDTLVGVVAAFSGIQA